MATLPPSAARRFAIAAPMPREPPVTSATFFANLDIDLLCFSGRDLVRVFQTVMNRSVLYDDGGLARMQDILNYLVLYRIICLWGARRTLVARKCWRRRCLSSGPTDFRTRASRTWNEPRA